MNITWSRIGPGSGGRTKCNFAALAARIWRTEESALDLSGRTTSLAISPEVLRATSSVEPSTGIIHFPSSSLSVVVTTSADELPGWIGALESLQRRNGDPSAMHQTVSSGAGSGGASSTSTRPALGITACSAAPARAPETMRRPTNPEGNRPSKTTDAVAATSAEVPVPSWTTTTREFDHAGDGQPARRANNSEPRSSRTTTVPGANAMLDAGANPGAFT